MNDKSTDTEIGEAIAALQSHYYANQPTAYMVEVTDNVVVVVLEETFTPAEQMLIDQGDAAGKHGIQTNRKAFQQMVEQEFVAIVENATGKHVRSFHSDTNLEERISIEVFILGDPRANMDHFEGGASMTDADLEAHEDKLSAYDDEA